VPRDEQLLHGARIIASLAIEQALQIADPRLTGSPAVLGSFSDVRLRIEESWNGRQLLARRYVRERGWRLAETRKRDEESEEEDAEK